MPHRSWAPTKLPISKAADYLGAHPATPRKCAREGRIFAQMPNRPHAIFTPEEVDQLDDGANQVEIEGPSHCANLAPKVTDSYWRRTYTTPSVGPSGP
jgi:hypothetical protein